MTDTQSTPEQPAKRNLLSRAVSLVTRPISYIARQLYRGLDNAIYNAPRLRPCLRDGLYVSTGMALVIAVFNVLVLTGTLGSYPGVFLAVNIVSLVVALGVLLPTRLSSQTHEDADWALLTLFSDRPSRDVAPEPTPVAKATPKKKAPASSRKPASKKASTKKPATKATAKKATPSATKAKAKPAAAKKTAAKKAAATRANSSDTTKTATKTASRPANRSKRSK